MDTTKRSRLPPARTSPQLYARITRPRTFAFTKIYTTWWETIPWTSNRSGTRFDLETAAPERCCPLELEPLKIPLCSRLDRPSSNQGRITLIMLSLLCLTQAHLKEAKWIYCRIKTRIKLLGASLVNRSRACKLPNALTFSKTMEVSFQNSITLPSKRKFKET